MQPLLNQHNFSQVCSLRSEFHGPREQLYTGFECFRIIQTQNMEDTWQNAIVYNFLLCIFLQHGEDEPNLEEVNRR